MGISDEAVEPLCGVAMAATGVLIVEILDVDAAVASDTVGVGCAAGSVGTGEAAADACDA